MSGIKYLLDTCFIIELYNGHQDVINAIQQKKIELNQCAISPINRIEVLGFSQLNAQNERNLRQLLDNLHTLNFDKNIENQCIDLRKRYKIKLPDCIVLSTALVHRLELLTLDNGLQNKFLSESQN